VKGVPYKGSTNIRCHCTKFRSHGNLANRVGAPPVVILYRYCYIIGRQYYFDTVSTYSEILKGSIAV